MDPLITVGTAMGTSLITSFATKGDSEPIKTLNDLWYLAFGRLQLFANQKRAKHEALLESYKKELVQEVSLIPDEDLVEPPLSIVGPALEASKYYIEEETLRKMFAKVVASSMDNRKNSRTHHSFIEIIKQISPLDAKNIAIFKNEKRYPIANFGIKVKSGTATFHRDIFLENKECEDVKLISSSLTNLKRLGLLETTYSTYLVDENLYAPFMEHDLYKEISTMVKTKEFQQQAQILKEIINLENCKIKLEKGIVELTPFGKDFIDVCL